MINGTVTGRLGADPTTKSAGSGTVTELSVGSTNGGGRDKGTTWVKASIWGKRGDAVAQYKRKGDYIVLGGEMILEEWQGRDGKMYTLRMPDVKSIDFGPKTQPADTGRNRGGGGYGGQSRGGSYGGGGGYGGGQRQQQEGHNHDEPPFLRLANVWEV